MIRLLLVDDHPVVRDGLRGVLAADPSMTVVGEASDGAEALRLLGSHDVDLVLMDLRMPGMGGVEATAAIRAAYPEVRVLVLTTYDSDRDVLPAIRAGAAGYLLKDAGPEALRQGVRDAVAGATVLAPSVAASLVGAVAAPAADVLSPRESEVLRAIAAGSTNREIAKQLFISEATVKTHLIHLYDKLGARDRASAVSVAYQRGLL